MGGGIAGLTLADRLTRNSGPTVTLLEAGGDAPSTHALDPFEAELRGRPHRGTGAGRVRAFGGSSLTWGGQLLPLPPNVSWANASDASEGDAREPLDPTDVHALLAKHGLPSPHLLHALPELVSRFSVFLPFSKRNLRRSIGSELRKSARVQVVLHGSVTELLLSPHRDRILGVKVRTPSGDVLHLEAEEFVLAAGTVETCRLLLASRTTVPEGVGNAFGQVGLHFHDHLTLSAATFSGEARARMLRELRPWVLRTGLFRRRLYSLKLEPSLPLRAELGLNAAMAHLTIEEPAGTGVERLRNVLRVQQGRGLRAALQEGARALPQIVLQALRLGFDAQVRRRRYVSSRATVRLQLNVGQDAPARSRVLLSDAVDAFGMPRAVVDWHVSAAELRTFRRFAGYLREGLRTAGIADGVAWEPALFTEGSEADDRLLDVIDDARHAMGGCCMGTDPHTSVVDAELRVHGIGNLSIASPAVFPDGSAQLPTLTLMQLCHRLARRLQRQLG